MRYRIFLLCIAIAGVTFPYLAAAQTVPTIALNLDYPKFGPFDLNVNQSLPEIIGFFYYFIVGISGLAAFVMLVYGGVQWLTSGAIPSQASEARDKVRNAIIGLLLVLASFLIIQVINPELTIIGGKPLVDPCSDPANAPTSTIKCTFGKAILPQPGANLTANGQPDLLCIQTSSTANVELQWTTTGISGCQAASAPSQVFWTGPKEDSGNAAGTLPIGTFDFLLSCAAFSDAVKVTVKDGSCVGVGTPITVDLKVRDSGAPSGSGTDGTIVFSSLPAENQIPSGSIGLDWTSSPTTATCDTNGGPFNNFFAIGRSASGSVTEMISSASPGTYTYTITCVDATGTQSAPPDSIIVEVKP